MRNQEPTVSSSPSGEHQQFAYSACSALSGLIAFPVLLPFVGFDYSLDAAGGKP